MTLIQSIILGCVEGITEFLPISSTGHMILVGNILHITQSEFTKSFEIIIQLGAICAVIVLYWRILLEKRTLWVPLFFAFLPTAILGFILYPFIKQFLLGNAMITVLSLFLGGVFFIGFEKIYKKSPTANISLDTLSIKKAMYIGLAQSISMIPGVSRSAASIMGGMSVGLDRITAIQFSFLLAIPTMIAATGLDLIKSSSTFSSDNIVVLSIGFIVAFLTALIAIKTFIRFVQNHTFFIFGIYRIIIALIYWFFFLRTG